MNEVSLLTCSRCSSEEKNTEVAPEPQPAELRVNSMHSPPPRRRGSSSGSAMGRQGGSAAHEAPHVSPVRKVSRLTASMLWSRSWSRNCGPIRSEHRVT